MGFFYSILTVEFNMKIKRYLIVGNYWIYSSLNLSIRLNKAEICWIHNCDTGHNLKESILLKTGFIKIVKSVVYINVEKKIKIK